MTCPLTGGLPTSRFEKRPPIHVVSLCISHDTARYKDALVLLSTMPQRLKAVDFDYTDDIGWGDYFDNQVARLAETARILDEFRDELIRRCDGLHFDELQEEWDYSQILLGGVTEDGSYRDRSLARVYRDLFGLQVENVTEVIEKEREGITPSTTVIVEETQFSRFVSDISEKAEHILQIAEETGLIYSFDIEAEYNFYDILSDQENLMQLLSDFLHRLQEVLPNYNQKALMIWTLDMSLNRYLSVAYPKLKDRESWNWLDETFGLEPVFSPQIPEDDENAAEKEKQYTIYSYQEGSLGQSLVDLYVLVWDQFEDGLRDSLGAVFPEIPNFKADFIDEAEEKLRQIDWEMPDYLEVVSEKSEREHAEETPSYGGVTTQATYHISGIVIDELRKAGYSTSGNYSSDTRAPIIDWSSDFSDKEKRDLGLLRVLDDLAPMLFLLEGVAYNLDIDEETLEVEKL